MNAPDPITEDDIAQFLLQRPDFFERHAELLARVQLTSPHSQRAISLQERQAELMREKIHQLELKSADMLRHGRDYARISAHLHGWTLELLRVADAAELPGAIERSLCACFDLPQAALRLWDLGPEHTHAPCTQGVTADARALADSLAQPFCGPNRGLSVVQWLPRPDEAAALAVLPLRPHAAAPGFGLLLLASNDAQRFTPDMGVDFLHCIAELASAALNRLRPSAALPT